MTKAPPQGSNTPTNDNFFLKKILQPHLSKFCPFLFISFFLHTLYSITQQEANPSNHLSPSTISLLPKFSKVHMGFIVDEEFQHLSLASILKHSTAIPKSSPKTTFFIILSFIFPLSYHLRQCLLIRLSCGQLPRSIFFS